MSPTLYVCAMFSSVSLMSIKSMSHDATSFMGFGLMKPVSSCYRARTCFKRLLKVSFDCFNDRTLLYSCNVFRERFPNKPIIFPIISVLWEKPTFIFSEHMVTIFTYHIHTSIQNNAQDIIMTEKHRS